MLNVGGNYTQLGEFSNARIYLNRGIKIAEDQDLFMYQAYGYNKLSELNSLEGNLEEALYYYKLKTAYNDSIRTRRTNEKVTFLKYQFELEKEKTISEKIKLKKKTNETIFLIILTILLIGVVVLLSWLYYVRIKANKDINRAREITEESESRFRALHNASFGGIGIHDKGNFLECNQGLTDITGYSKSELLEMDGFKLIAEQSRELVRKNIESGYEQPYEAIGLHKNGKEFPLRLESRNVPYKGKEVRTVEFRDITDQKNAEIEIIKAKEKAEESERLKSSFLANMSHEIRTPMNGILGFADLLKKPNLDGEMQQRYIGIIEKAGARMLNIINDIVSISKIESGLMEFHRQESNINEQIVFIYNFFKPEVEGIDIDYRYQLTSEEAFIMIDREKVYAVLTNLVKNAIKYTEKGSIEFGYKKRDDLLEFYVKDTGIGIPKDRHEAIFERFIQADIADKNAFQGAGLGLSISKAYVEMLGGEIWVESEEGKGSVFYFTIPYHNQKVIEGTEFKDIKVVSKFKSIDKLKILIVEDDEISEELIEIAVKSIGKEILKATTGEEAVEACIKSPDIDLVLMDIQLPIMNGYEATKQIRSFNKDVVIIAQTAFALRGDKEKSIAAGCNDYITKPINSQDLILKITEHFKKQG